MYVKDTGKELRLSNPCQLLFPHQEISWGRAGIETCGMSVLSEVEHSWLFQSWKKKQAPDRAMMFFSVFSLGCPNIYVLAAEDSEGLFWRPLAEFSVFLAGDWAQGHHEVWSSWLSLVEALWAITSRRLRRQLCSSLHTPLVKEHRCQPCCRWVGFLQELQWTGEHNVRTTQKGGQVERRLWNTAFPDGRGEVVLSEEGMNLACSLWWQVTSL